MRSKISKKILSETSKETKDKVNDYANKLILSGVSKCYDCKKEYTDKDKEHGMCQKCWQPIIE